MFECCILFNARKIGKRYSEKSKDKRLFFHELIRLDIAL